MLRSMWLDEHSSAISASAIIIAGIWAFLRKIFLLESRVVALELQTQEIKEEAKEIKDLLLRLDDKLDRVIESNYNAK